LSWLVLKVEIEELQRLRAADGNEILRLQEENCYLLTEMVTMEGTQESDKSDENAQG
jgi:hypothetical protein